MKLCLFLLCTVALAVYVSGVLDRDYRGRNRGRNRGRSGPKGRPLGRHGRRQFGRDRIDFDSDSSEESGESGEKSRSRQRGIIPIGRIDFDSHSSEESGESRESGERSRSRQRGIHHRLKSRLGNLWTQLFPSLPESTQLTQLWVPDGFPDFSIDLDLDLDFQNWFGKEQRQWWTGPNVCVTKEETEEENEAGSAGKKITNHHLFTNTVCDESDSAYKCTTTLGINGKKKIVTEIHECCHGFQREKGKKGCTKELVIRPLHDTLEASGAGEFARALQGIGLEELLGGYNYTVFAPLDEAFKDFLPDKVILQMGEDVDSNVIMVSPELVGMATQVRDTVTSHIVPAMLKTSQLKDEQVLRTLNQNASIRINFYDTPKKLVTANCVPVESSDHLAEGGVVHVVSAVLQPVTETLMDIVAKDPELSMMKTMIGRVGLADSLRSEGQYTLLAPTNAAISQLPADLQDRLLSGHSCLQKVLQNHLLPNVICSSVIEGHAKTRNQLGKYVNLTKTEDGKLFAGNGQMIVRDVMGSNGVLHIIDDVLIPEEALDVLDAAEKAGATEFLSLMHDGNLTKALRSLSNFTIFIPTNEAIRKMSQKTWMILQQSPMSLLQYHMLPSVEKYAELHNDMNLPTQHWKQSLRIKEYHSLPFGLRHEKTVQCARMAQSDIESCNGVAHMVDRVLIPPKGHLLEVLTQDGRFRSLTNLLRKSGLHEQLIGETSLTVFAPTDQAFESVPRDKLENIMKDGESLKKFLNYHIITDVTCCAGVFDSMMWGQREQTLEGDFISLRRRNDNILVGKNTPVATCDITATNGVIHVLHQPITEAVLKYGGHEDDKRERNHKGRGNHGRRGHKGRFRERVKDHLSKIFGVDLDSLWDVSFDWGATDKTDEARK